MTLHSRELIVVSVRAALFREERRGVWPGRNSRGPCPCLWPSPHFWPCRPQWTPAAGPLCSFQAHLPRSLSSTCTVPWTALLLVSTPAPPSLLSLVHLLVPLPTCLLTWAPEVQILNLPLSLLERDLPNCLLLSQPQSQDAWVQISVSPCLAVWPWACYFTSLSLLFLMCQMGIIRMVSPSWGVGGDNQHNCIAKCSYSAWHIKAK